jgi:hypothetical protein
MRRPGAVAEAGVRPATQSARRKRWRWWSVLLLLVCSLAAVWALLSIVAVLFSWPYFGPALVLTGLDRHPAAADVQGQYAGWWPDGFKDLLTLNPDGTFFQDVKNNGVWSTNTGTWSYEPEDGELQLHGLDDSHAYSPSGSITGTLYCLRPLDRLWLDTGGDLDYFKTTPSGVQGRLMWPFTLPIALFYAKAPSGAPHQR